METLKFRTNINCSGCVAGVTPALNETVGEGNWHVDIATPEKILTVDTDQDELEIIVAVTKAGFVAAKV
ncbi:MAG: hypothetical protein J7619_01095 [Dyadobacter sp.]|uniref:heavy-metal-associated domain-containing protein n=1 Tax=Dyadobacter sp. TaxID=1914288 RepID=UPI001B0AB110|nr:hypothetical protein [Dyadobacter sp.]MBO9611254.1 hypothetical protein [Dyadobacter sp.]